MQISETLVAAIRREFPHFRIVPKRHDLLSQVLDRLLRIITFGSQNQFMASYHTVIGNTLYVPDAWERTSDVDRAIVLRHERVHLRQRRRHGFLLFAFLYLVPIFPIGLAYGRARLEWEAYAETLLATAELKGLAAANDVALREKIIERFTGGDYGWMWPFRHQIERWYEQTLSDLAEHDSAPRGLDRTNIEDDE